MPATTLRPLPARTTPRRHPAPPTPSSGCVGIVTALEQDRFAIRSGGADLRGRRAVSCLLEPVVGDTVNCVMVAPDEVWIVAILMREQGAAHTLSLQGATAFNVEGGALCVQAADLHFESRACTLATRKLDVSVDEAEVVGRQFRLIGSGIKLVAALVETVADRIARFSRQYQRHTQETDRVRAQIIDHEATQLLTQTAEHVMVNGRRLVKTRGGQIHFG